MAVSPLAGVPQARHLTNGSCDSQVSQIVCWQTQSIHSELESADQGPVGVGLADSDRGLSHPLLISSQTRGHTSQPSLFIREPDLAAGGDTNLAGETSHRNSPSPDNGLLLQHVYGAQERWWSETSYQPKKAKQPCEVRALQNGEPSHSEIPSSEGRLDEEGRPEGCLLYGTSSTTIPPSPPLQSECRVIPVSMSPLRAMHCSEGVHKGPQTCYRASENLGHHASDLHGRHAPHGQFSTANPRAHIHSTLSPGESGVCHQQPKPY